MQAVTMYRTFDGKLHASAAAARTYLEGLYGNALCGVAHRLVNETAGKYTKTVDFLDANLAALVEISKIKQDMELVDAADEPNPEN